MPEFVNLFNHLVQRNIEENRGDKTALIYKNHCILYNEVEEKSRLLSSFFSNNNIGRTDRVILLLPDSPTFVYSFFGAVNIGAIVVPVSPYSSQTDVQYIISSVDPKIILIDESFAAKFSDLLSSTIPTFLSGDFVSYFSMLEQATSNLPTRKANSVFEKDLLAYCLFSSGTTGKPKGITHRHVDIIENIKAFSLPVLGMSDKDTVIAVPKLTFGYGLGGNLLSTFCVGGTSILLPEQTSAQAMINQIEKSCPTILLAQPRILAGIINSNVDKNIFKSIRMITSAGEILSESLLLKWKEKFEIDILDGFGTTEVGHVFITNRPGDIKPGCAGKLVDGFNIKILDDFGQPVNENQVGNLWVSGPSLAKEYWKDDERTSLNFKNGWVRTGDLVRQDKDKYVYISGRSDDMIKAGCGQWVAPLEIEMLLEEDPDVAECGVAGWSDQDGVIQPKAYVVLSHGVSPTDEIFQRLLNSVISKWPDQAYKHLGKVEFVSNLPHSHNGKLQRFKLYNNSLTEFSYDC